MREYLFELRKKANKTQKEIDRYVLEKYGFEMQYINIELGRLWKDLSGQRAEMLADALGTTPEYILKCEAEQGGYNRYSAVSNYDRPHKVKNGRRTEYDEPLTDEEKAMIEEYLPYVDNVIERLKYGRYKSVLDVLMSSADFYDIGILAFLRMVKSLTVQRQKDPEYFNAIDELVAFYRFNFSRAIESEYKKYIRAANAARRKASINALAFDAEVNDGETDTDLYNFVPSKDLPIPVEAESDWTLDKLYSYLSKKQIRACEMLIAGWTTGEVIKQGYSSQRDICIIRFYLEQFKVYGKILWRAEEYKADTPNIHFSFTSLRWIFAVSYKNKKYSMGTYKDLNDALDLQLIAHSHIIAGDFLQWHKKHLTLNSANVMVFTYPLPCDKDIDLSSLPSLSEKPQIAKKITRATRENPVGIFVNKGHGTYAVQMGSKYKLGSCKTLDEALNLRRIAEDHYIAGDLDSWYADFTSQKEKASVTYARLEDKHTVGNIVNYAVVRSTNGKIILLGRYPYEEALKVKELADSHVDKGDFIEWSEKFYADYLKERSSKPTYARMDKTVVNGMDKYIVRGSYLTKPYRLGTYFYEEAVKVKALADSHIDAGDFPEWSAAFMEEYKKKHPRKNTNNRIVYARIDKFQKHGATVYEVIRTYNRKRFRLGQYSSYEEADKVKALADSHINAGDFDEWSSKFYEDYKVKTKIRRYGDKQASEERTLSLNYFAAYVICKYLSAKYSLLCYDTSGSEHLLCETSDVEEAYKTMDLANEHIEAGDFNAWFADYKN